MTRGFNFKLCATRAYRELEEFKLWSRRTREHVLEGAFAYDFRNQHIRIDKSGQVRLKSWKTSWIGLLVRSSGNQGPASRQSSGNQGPASRQFAINPWVVPGRPIGASPSPSEMGNEDMKMGSKMAKISHFFRLQRLSAPKSNLLQILNFQARRSE